jgi:hypothetical protein
MSPRNYQLLRESGMIRVHANISVELNDHLKKCAKQANMHADDFIGHQITEHNADFFNAVKIDKVADYAMEQLGPTWMEILKSKAFRGQQEVEALVHGTGYNAPTSPRNDAIHHQ